MDSDFDCEVIVESRVLGGLSPIPIRRLNEDSADIRKELFRVGDLDVFSCVQKPVLNGISEPQHVEKHEHTW
jgi:hypothetical protein